MEHICELCGTKLIKRSTIHCEACPKCGHIQNMTLTSPDKIFGENGE